MEKKNWCVRKQILKMLFALNQIHFHEMPQLDAHHLKVVNLSPYNT